MIQFSTKILHLIESFEGINIALFIVSTTVQVLFVWTLFNMQNSDHAIEKFVGKKKKEKSHHMGDLKWFCLSDTYFKYVALCRFLIAGLMV